MNPEFEAIYADFKAKVDAELEEMHRDIDAQIARRRREAWERSWVGRFWRAISRWRTKP